MEPTPDEVLASLEAYLRDEIARNGGPAPALRPDHRKLFIWPRHSVSAQYNVKHNDFVRAARFEAYGEAFSVAIAHTAFGVFGRCDSLKAEAKGVTEAAMFENLRKEVEPLFQRQFAISRILGLSRRYEGAVQDLAPADLIKLLFCVDRDVAHVAMMTIDARATSGLFTPSLIRILRDESHPNRRIAQWCALDIFEDLPNVCVSTEQLNEAIASVQEFMMKSPDDYARAIYKAGDVLGDHIASVTAGEALLRVLESGPQPFGRRSAIHGLIHFCEWFPQQKELVLQKLEAAAKSDPLPVLREYAKATIGDIVSGGPHGPEPILPEEAA